MQKVEQRTSGAPRGHVATGAIGVQKSCGRDDRHGDGRSLALAAAQRDGLTATSVKHS